MCLSERLDCFAFSIQNGYTDVCCLEQTTLHFSKTAEGEPIIVTQRNTREDENLILNDAPVLILHLSTISVLIVLFVLFKMKRKQEIHYISIGLILSVFIWCAGMLAEAYAVWFLHYSGMVFTNIYFSAVGFVSIFIFLLGRSFSSGSDIKRGNYLLLLFPVFNAAAIWTNDFHHLFFIKYSLVNSEMIRGPLMMLQLFIAYPLVLLGLSFLVYFSIRNSSIFSKQSILIVIGTIVPVAVDIAFVFNLFQFSMYYEPISFAFSALCFMLAIRKYNFLNIVPIAWQTVIGQISDSYIVVNEDFWIIDYNQPFSRNFAWISDIERNTSVWTWADRADVISKDHSKKIRDALNQTFEDRIPVSLEKSFEEEGIYKVFTVEISPVILHGSYRGSIIMLKDITEIRKSYDLLRQTQAQLTEKEHLISLGHLIGGIAHNLKTPIMSISGGIEGINELISEYEESIDDPTVDQNDHREIALEMRSWTDKMKNYCEYMSDVISAVKGQTAQLTSSTTENFELSELLKRIEILMNHELKSFGCKLNIVCGIEKSTLIKGEVNSLVQIVNNLITNSIEAYNGNEGVIDLIISQEGTTLQLCIRDFGNGISEEVQNKLFKEMITTKAKMGTGLGLYMSYSTIIGKFGGKMWFISKGGEETSFFIAIPVV